MNILIRNLQQGDFDIYKKCYSNTEFKKFMYGNKKIDIDDCFLKMLENARDNRESYVVFYSTDEQTTKYNIVGFCNFLKYDKYPFEVSRETFAINGGLLPSLFNKGIGIYSCVSILSLFFHKHPDSDLYASTFEDNIRSSKMLTAVGFEQLNQTWFQKNHFILDKRRFSCCNFSTHLLSRVNITLEE